MGGQSLTIMLRSPDSGKWELQIGEYETLCDNCASRRDSWPWWEPLELVQMIDPNVRDYYDQDWPICHYFRDYNAPFKDWTKAKDCGHPECQMPNWLRAWS